MARSQVKSGYIPKRITYVSRPEETVNTRWDGTPDETAFIVERDVIPSFPVPEGNAKRLKTARDWASGWSGEHTPVEQTENNKPISLQLCGLEIRDEGGRAYKVVDQQNRYFDLREDVLLELALECGIRKGGKLGGKFIWAVMGSHIRLVRDGSILHKMMQDATQRGTLKKIGKNDLVPGGIYRTKKGDTAVFIGHVMSSKKAGERAKKKLLWLEIASWVDDAAKYAKKVFSPANLKTKPSKITAPKKKDYISTDNWPSPEGCWAFKIVASHSMIEKVGEAKIPKDAVEKAHQISVIAMQQRIRYDKHYSRYNPGSRSNNDSLGYYYEWCHHYPLDGAARSLEEYKQLQTR
jgi:hypothetical protein